MMRRITFTSSSNKIFIDHLGNRIVMMGIGISPPALTPFYSRVLDIYVYIFKDDVNRFSSTLDNLLNGKTRIKD